MKRYAATVGIALCVCLGWSIGGLVFAQGTLPALTPLYSVDLNEIPSTVQERWATDPEACIAETLRFLEEKQAQIDPERTTHWFTEELYASIAAIPADPTERQAQEDRALIESRLESVESTPETDPNVWEAWSRVSRPLAVEP